MNTVSDFYKLYGAPLEEQVAFVDGFISSLDKEAGLSLDAIVNILEDLSTQGANSNLDEKQASAASLDIHEAFVGIREKIAEPNNGSWLNPLNWPGKTMDRIGESAGRANAETLISKGQEMLSGLGSSIGSGLSSLSDPETLKTIAPWVIGGLGGYLIPKMLGGEQSGMQSLATTALGAAAVGGGSLLLNRAMSGDDKAWTQWKQTKLK